MFRFFFFFIILFVSQTDSLLQGDESRRVGRTNTRATVLDGLVRNGELSQVVSNHFGLNFDTVEVLSVVDTDDASDHLRDNNHVPQVCLDTGGPLSWHGSALGSTETLKQGPVLALHPSVGERTAGTSRKQIDQMSIGEVQQFVEVNTSVAVLAKGSLLGCFGHFDK
eukprot:122280_1